MDLLIGFKRDIILAAVSAYLFKQYLNPTLPYIIFILFMWNILWWVILTLYYQLRYYGFNRVTPEDLKVVTLNILTISFLPIVIIHDSQRVTCSLLTDLRDMTLFIVLEDVFFYLFHRGMHIRSVYVWVHSKHHRYIHPEPIYAQYATLAETLINSLTLMLATVCVRPSVNATFMLAPILIANNVGAHSSQQGLHLLHHNYKNCNFGTNYILDLLLGTYRAR